MYLFAGSSNKKLAKEISKKAGLRLGKIQLSRFDNDEARVRIEEKRVGTKCVVLQSLSEPTDHHLVELLLICDALKRIGVKEIVGVVPWLGYSKQDKVFRPGEPLSIKVIAKTLQVAGMSQVITADLHSDQIKQYFTIPVKNLSTVELLARGIKVSLDTVVVAPDKGAVEKSQDLAKALGCKLVKIEKKRDLETGKVKIIKVRGQVKDKQVVIVDDMIATGSTLIETAKILKDRGVQSIKVLATHNLYVEGVQEKLDKSGIDELVVSNSVEAKVKTARLKVMSLAGLISNSKGLKDK